MTKAQPAKRQQPKPQLKQPTPLSVLCARYDISLSMLSDLCGGPGNGGSRSSADRLKWGETIRRAEAVKLRSRLASSLPLFLAEQRGLDRSTIDRELIEIFEEGEYQPMISKRVELSSQAIAYFGLSDDAFKRPPRSKAEVFIAPELQQIIDRVVDAIQYQGFVCITGEIGSGKSTIRQLIEDRIAEDDKMLLVWPEFFDMSRITPMQIAAAILNDMSQPIPQSALMRANRVKQQLADRYRGGHRVAIAFDEVHRLSDGALSSLKNFLEMSSGGFQRYLGVLMFGQPVFEHRLTDPKFRELVERIVIIPMPDFSRSAEAYLRHRLAIVGGDLDKLFDREAIDLLCGQASTPLQLGNIANEALKISMETFDERQVIGSAIKTKMFFENRQQGFRKR